MENLQIERRNVKDTDVFIGENIIKEMLPRVRTVFEEGALFVVYEKEQESVATALMQEMKRGGYRVFASEIRGENYGGEGVQSADIPEYVRFVFAVGEELASREAKRICEDKNIEWALIMCTPSCDEIMKGKSPKQVFIDTEVIDKSAKERVAAGYGHLLSLQFSAFECAFSSKVLGVCKSTFAADCKGISNGELAFLLLKLSSEKTWEDSADKMAKLLVAKALSEGKKPRLLGEYKFLCACLITSFYSAFLGAPSIDAMPPACRDDALDEIVSLPIDLSNEGKCVDFFDINSYFRINYIMSEYRMDLLEKLAGIDLHGMQRFWRRLYPDAGYWLKSEISAKEMLHFLCLAGAKSDNLLGYAYASGMLKKIG